MKSYFRFSFQNTYIQISNYLHVSLSARNLNAPVTFVLILFFTLTIFFGMFVIHIPVVYGYACGFLKWTPAGKITCCVTDKNGISWCTDCDDTSPISNCSPRYRNPEGAVIGGAKPPTNVAPPKVCPDGSSPDANGACPPVTQGTPPSPPPKGATGAIEQPPTNLASQPSTSQTTTCPDGSSPDANGQCPPPTTTGNQNPQSLNNNNNNNNNVQSQQQENNKGSNLLGHAGELTGKKKGSSPTPPPCPTDNSPIPPNCTLKPKF
jgi:hypothetical protein